VSHRIEQLASAIEKALREIVAKGFNDPRISGLITITNVRVLPDLSQAFIGVSVLPESKQELTLHGLSAAATYIRREAGELVNTRTLPQFVFRLDTSLKKEAAIIRELDKVRAERESRGEAAPDAAPPEDQQT
jgi:ribosome-binding factor A